MRRVAPLLVAFFLMTGCSGDRPPAPVTAPSSTAASPTTTLTLTRIWLCCGSDQVQLNSSRQIELWATYLDGSSGDVTASATGWKSSNPSVATISDRGIVRGLASGTFEVSATFAGLDAKWGMYVPIDYYRSVAPDEIVGTVHELTVNGQTPVARATLEIVAGEQFGLKLVADHGGFFRIGNLRSGGFDLVVSDPAYATRHIRVATIGRDLTPELAMMPAATMTSEVLEAGVCWPYRTVSIPFTPAHQGPLRITSARGSSTRREVLEDGVVINTFLSNNVDQAIRAGRNYELRVSGSCDYDPSASVRMTYLRPR